MKSILCVLCLLFVGTIQAQRTYSICVSDRYSFRSLINDSSFTINRKIVFIDTINQAIFVKKRLSRRLIVHVDNYEPLNVGFPNKKVAKKEIALQLLPEKNLISQEYARYWDTDEKSSDTLFISSVSELETTLLTRLNYLVILQDTCYNGMCNYANNYVYEFRFSRIDSVFKLTEVLKKQPIEYTCDPLEEHLLKLMLIFPVISINHPAQELRMKYLIQL